MIALLDAPPDFCPECGEGLPNWTGPWIRAEFFAGDSHSCKCGFTFQYVRTTALVEMSKGHGDLADYILDEVAP